MPQQVTTEQHRKKDLAPCVNQSCSRLTVTPTTVSGLKPNFESRIHEVEVRVPSSSVPKPNHRCGKGHRQRRRALWHQTQKLKRAAEKKALAETAPTASLKSILEGFALPARPVEALVSSAAKKRSRGKRGSGAQRQAAKRVTAAEKAAASSNEVVARPRSLAELLDNAVLTSKELKDQTPTTGSRQSGALVVNTKRASARQLPTLNHHAALKASPGLAAVGMGSSFAATTGPRSTGPNSSKAPADASTNLDVFSPLLAAGGHNEVCMAPYLEPPPKSAQPTPCPPAVADRAPEVLRGVSPVGPKALRKAASTTQRPTSAPTPETQRRQPKPACLYLMGE